MRISAKAQDLLMPLTRRRGIDVAFRQGDKTVTIEANIENGGRMNPWRIAAWSLAALLLLLPLVAMQFTAEVNWTASDFVFAGVLIGSVGLALELAVRMSRNRAYRAGIGFALAAAFLILWSNAAVGMIGDEDNPYNLLFLGIIGLALLGSIAARFRAAAMAHTMIAAAVAHLAVALGGLSTDGHGAGLSAAFAGLWLLSAVLFRKAAREAEATGSARNG
jgi:hypothetical protein